MLLQASVFTLGDAARFFGYFLLVMGVIYAALLLTSWFGKKYAKHDKVETPDGENEEP